MGPGTVAILIKTNLGSINNIELHLALNYTFERCHRLVL